MGDEDDKKMSPEDGLKGVFDLINDLADATSQNNLTGMDSILARLDQIVSDTGVEIPGIADRLDMLKGKSSRAQHHIENTEAAMWVGDLARAEDLSSAGPGLDLDALLGDTGIDLSDIDEENEDDEVDEDDTWQDSESELSAFLADAGFEEPDPADILPDLCADIAKDKPGAIDAFIASGEDLNIPRGTALHTALFAALDAPNRRAEEINKLLAAGADAQVIHAYGDNALSWAAGYHHPETVTAESEVALMTLLAAEGADPNHVTALGNWTVLHRAIIQGDAARVAAILAAGADATTPVFAEFQPEKLAHFTCVMLAAPKPQAMQALIDHGVDPATLDGLGRNPVEVIAAETQAARARATEDDPWTVAHAEALETSLAILTAATGTR